MKYIKATIKGPLQGRIIFRTKENAFTVYSTSSGKRTNKCSRESISQYYDDESNARLPIELADTLEIISEDEIKAILTELGCIKPPLKLCSLGDL